MARKILNWNETLTAIAVIVALFLLTGCSGDVMIIQQQGNSSIGGNLTSFYTASNKEINISVAQYSYPSWEIVHNLTELNLSLNNNMSIEILHTLVQTNNGNCGLEGTATILEIYDTDNNLIFADGITLASVIRKDVIIYSNTTGYIVNSYGYLGTSYLSRFPALSTNSQKITPGHNMEDIGLIKLKDDSTMGCYGAGSTRLFWARGIVNIYDGAKTW